MKSIDKDACRYITQSIRSNRLSYIFNLPEKESDYYKQIKYPIDFDEIIKKLDADHYDSVSDWMYDMNMVWLNLTTYWGIDTYFADVAAFLQKEFDRLVKEKIRMRDSGFWNKEIVRIFDKIENLLDAAPDLVWIALDKMIHRERPNSLEIESISSIINKLTERNDKMAFRQILRENKLHIGENTILSNYPTSTLCSIVYYLKNRKR